MRVMSNAFFDHAEITQLDRWELGPLELAMLDDWEPRVEMVGAVSEWNRHGGSGLVRPADTLELLQARLPWLTERGNPNLFLVPRSQGFTELHAMLASLVPPEYRARYGVPESLGEGIFWLTMFREEREAVLAEACERAFEAYIWEKLARSGRLKREFFRADSPLRLLSGDSYFWMSRVYRIALSLYEELPEVEADKGWAPIEEIRERFTAEIGSEEAKRFLVHRPRLGGSLWHREDAEEREMVLDAAIDGGGVLDSLEPVIEVLQHHPAHEDFSNRYSWVKEDFERSFYSKRSRVKVTMVETVDDLPVWSGNERIGYENVLFRDLLTACDVKERRVILALRQGRTASQIASENGLKGHASISRTIARLKRKLEPLLK